jgi:subtilase family serine protease
VGDLPDQRDPGQTLVVGSTTTNTGLAPAGTSVTRFYLSEDDTRAEAVTRLVGNRNIPELAPGQQHPGNRTVRVPEDTPPGIYRLLACSDDTKQVTEADETNNCTASAGWLTIGNPLPDLIVAAVSAPPVQRDPGGTFSVTSTTANVGLLAAPSSRTRFYLSTDRTHAGATVRLFGAVAVPDLIAGAEHRTTRTVTIPDTAPQGTYHLLACADDLRAVDEADEANNCRPTTGRIIVGPAPDLTITAVTDPPSQRDPGATFPITATTANTGTGAAGASSTRFYLATNATPQSAVTRLWGTLEIPALDPGGQHPAERTLTVPPTTPHGRYRVLACADDLDTVLEPDETNNCRATTGHIIIGPAPDLTITAVSDPPGQRDPGGTFTVSSTVANIGTATAAASTTRFYLSTDTTRDGVVQRLSGNRAVAELTPGASATGSRSVTVPTTTPRGIYHLLACADDAGVVAEADETNNCRAATARIVIGPIGPDLTITAISDPPTSRAPGATFTITTTAANIGTADAAASTTRFYLSTTPTPDGTVQRLSGNRTVPELAPGTTATANRTLTVPTTTPPGTYHLLACADDLNAITELDETNNCRTATTRMTITP